MIEAYKKQRFKDNSIKNFRLAGIRAYKNLSMRDLAKKAEIKFSYYAAIEGMRLYPPEDIREKISYILKEKADYLFPERFKSYCLEHRREITGFSEDVLDKLNRVSFNSKALKKTPDNENYQKSIENKDVGEYIRNLLDNLGLPEVEKKVFYSRFGLEDREFCTLEGLGKIFHVTKQRIKQRELHVLARLKFPARLRELEDLFLC